MVRGTSNIALFLISHICLQEKGITNIKHIKFLPQKYAHNTSNQTLFFNTYIKQPGLCTLEYNGFNSSRHLGAINIVKLQRLVDIFKQSTRKRPSYQLPVMSRTSCKKYFIPNQHNQKIIYPQGNSKI